MKYLNKFLFFTFILTLLEFFFNEILIKDIQEVYSTKNLSLIKLRSPCLRSCLRKICCISCCSGSSDDKEDEEESQENEKSRSRDRVPRDDVLGFSLELSSISERSETPCSTSLGSRCSNKDGVDNVGFEDEDSRNPSIPGPSGYDPPKSGLRKKPNLGSNSSISSSSSSSSLSLPSLSSISSRSPRSSLSSLSSSSSRSRSSGSSISASL